ncbi:NAD(P)/FAD-dependent oxidoreductase [Mycobacterium sp.]|uniref:flavin-containing monooxygenase n=1 Tax=Mycobacterium sp. TaxID=1785 RepID=UPI0012171AC7|nr:NAD(P)/FAD-dependent oxidoreductase [Mycobacterium sp.]TAM67873.1 MAG: NAD(P)/FAD-dependent oxidoreductase [Mycobacterium sp.]
MSECPVVVVGAGAAGVAAASSLRNRGVKAVVLESTEKVASAWRNRYDHLRLNTGKQFSHLPKCRYPRGTTTFPSRDQVVEHIERSAYGLDIQFKTVVERIDRGPGGWCLHTSAGDVRARQVIVATGYDHTPHMPEWPGMQGFTGELLHSSAYRNPTRCAGKRVLVVGSGSSGMEIAYDVATGGAASVWMAVRTPPNIMLCSGPGGLPGDVIATPLYHLPQRVADGLARLARLRAIGDLTEFGLPIPHDGPFSRAARLGVAPALVDIAVIDAVKDGDIEVVKPPQSFDAGAVSLLGGRRLHPDVVVCATGYRRGLESLVGHLEVLDERGVPRCPRGESVAEGLRFLGFLPRPSQLGYSCKRARRIANEIANGLR